MISFSLVNWMKAPFLVPAHAYISLCLANWNSLKTEGTLAASPSLRWPGARWSASTMAAVIAEVCLRFGESRSIPDWHIPHDCCDHSVLECRPGDRGTRHTSSPVITQGKCDALNVKYVFW